MKMPIIAVLLSALFLLAGLFASGYLLLSRLFDGATHSVGLIIFPVAAGTLISVAVGVLGMFAGSLRD